MVHLHKYVSGKRSTRKVISHTTTSELIFDDKVTDIIHCTGYAELEGFY
jgi:hypothetical protein